MELTHLFSHQSLITETSTELVTFAEFLEIPADIDLGDDHIFIMDKVGALSLGSFRVRRDSDVVLPTELFCKILMDIKAGMTVIDAYNSRGYTF